MHVQHVFSKIRIISSTKLTGEWIIISSVINRAVIDQTTTATRTTTFGGTGLDGQVNIDVTTIPRGVRYSQTLATVLVLGRRHFNVSVILVVANIIAVLLPFSSLSFFIVLCVAAATTTAATTAATSILAIWFGLLPWFFSCTTLVVTPFVVTALATIEGIFVFFHLLGSQSIQVIAYIVAKGLVTGHGNVARHVTYLIFAMRKCIAHF